MMDMIQVDAYATEETVMLKPRSVLERAFLKDTLKLKAGSKWVVVHAKEDGELQHIRFVRCK